MENEKKKVDWATFMESLPYDAEVWENVARVTNLEKLTDDEKWTLVEPIILKKEAESGLPGNLPIAGQGGSQSTRSEGNEAEAPPTDQPPVKPQISFPKTESEIAEQRRNDAWNRMNSLDKEQYYKRQQRKKEQQQAY